MVEKIYDTLKGILYNDLPKDAIGNVVIYDRPVRNWFIGDRDVKPANLSIMIYSANFYFVCVFFYKNCSERMHIQNPFFWNYWGE